MCNPVCSGRGVLSCSSAQSFQTEVLKSNTEEKKMSHDPAADFTQTCWCVKALLYIHTGIIVRDLTTATVTFVCVILFSDVFHLSHSRVYNHSGTEAASVCQTFCVSVCAATMSGLWRSSLGMGKVAAGLEPSKGALQPPMSVTF